MIFNVLIFLVIVLTTMYLATQGMVSAMIALATAIFASVLAMALTEPLQGIIGGFRPDYARGVTFLLLFLFAFSATRIAADVMIKKNIKLNLWINRGMGAAFGFFTALVVAGTIVLGIEMMPVPRKLLGFDRFPAPTVMASIDADGKPIPGEATSRRSGIWFSPDGFVLSLWSAASGRSLGGAEGRSWNDLHPDFRAESYGDRYPVFAGSGRSLARDLVEVKEIWSPADPKDLPGGVRPPAGKRVVVVRAEIKKGEKPPHSSSDVDNYFRVAVAQVRLITDKNHQAFPMGDLFQGRTFEPLALDNGFVVDDYSSSNTAVQEWVFAIPEGESPRTFVIKGAQVDGLAGRVKDKPAAPLRVAEYPARGYYKDLCTFTVTFDPVGAEVLAGRVYVLKPDAKIKDIIGAMRGARDRLQSIYDDMSNGTGGYSGAKPGIPAVSTINMWLKRARDMTTDPEDNNVTWAMAVPTFLSSQTTPDPRGNVDALPRYMRDEMEKLWNSVSTGSIISGIADADNSDGGVWKATVRRITPGQHPVVVMLQTKTGFYVWTPDLNFADPAKKDVTFLATADPAAGTGTGFHLDLKP
jgi:hypothetical protein